MSDNLHPRHKHAKCHDEMHALHLGGPNPNDVETTAAEVGEARGEL